MKRYQPTVPDLHSPSSTIPQVLQVLCGSNCYDVSRKTRVYSVKYSQYHNYTPFTHNYTTTLQILCNIYCRQCHTLPLNTMHTCHFPSPHQNYCYNPQLYTVSSFSPQLHTVHPVTFPNYKVHTVTLVNLIMYTQLYSPNTNCSYSYTLPLKMYKQLNSQTTYCTHSYNL